MFHACPNPDCGRREEARTHLEDTLQWQQEGQVRRADLQATEEALADLG